MTLIGKKFYNRIAEIPKLLDKFIEWDLERTEYQGTYVLDCGTYGEEFLIECCDVMRRYLA